MEALIAAFLIKIHRVLTGNEMQFIFAPRYTDSGAIHDAHVRMRCKECDIDIG